MHSLRSLIIEVPSLVYSYHFCIWKLHIDFQTEDKQASRKVEKSTEKCSDTAPGLHVQMCLCAESMDELRKDVKINEKEKI
jgi:hypothetical protein